MQPSELNTNEDFFASRLASLRQKQNVSARKMSLALEQNSSYINRIENKKAFPSMQVFFQICDYLDVTPGDFFERGGVNPSDEMREFLSLLEKLTPAQQEMLKGIAVEFAALNKSLSEK